MKKLKKHKITKEFVDTINSYDFESMMDGLLISVKLSLSEEDYYDFLGGHKKANGSYYNISIEERNRSIVLNGIYEYSIEYLEAFKSYRVSFYTKRVSRITDIYIDFDIHKVVNREKVINSLI